MQNIFNKLIKKVKLVFFKTLIIAIPAGMPKGIFNYCLCIALLNLVNFLFACIYLIFGFWEIASIMLLLFILKEFYFLILRKYSFSISVFYLILVVNIIVTISIYILHFKILYTLYLLCLVMAIHSSKKSILKNRIPHIITTFVFIFFYFFVLFEKTIVPQPNFTWDKLLICCYVFCLFLIVSHAIFMSETMNSIRRNYLELELRNINKKLSEANKEAIQFSQASTSYFKSNLKIFDYHFEKIEEGINSLLPIEELHSHFFQLQKTLDDEIKFIDNIFLYNQVITHRIEFMEWNLLSLIKNLETDSNIVRLSTKNIANDTQIHTDIFLFKLLLKLISKNNNAEGSLKYEWFGNSYKLSLAFDKKTIIPLKIEEIIIDVVKINQENIELFILKKILVRLYGNITNSETTIILTFNLQNDLS